MVGCIGHDDAFGDSAGDDSVETCGGDQYRPQSVRRLAHLRSEVSADEYVSAGQSVWRGLVVCVVGGHPCHG